MRYLLSAVVKSVVPFIAALLGMSCATWLFYPGFMNGDASWQLKFAREFKFIDWHPPLMSLIWRELDFLLPGTASLFLLQIALYWISIAVFCQQLFKNRYLQFVLVLVAGFSPALFIGTALILKDSLTLGFLMLSAALIKVQEKKASLLLQSITVLTLMVASGLRYNSFIAVIPLLYWFSSVTSTNLTIYPKIFKSVLLSVIVLFGVFQINSWLLSDSNRLAPSIFFGSDPLKTSSVSNFPGQMILAYDLVGISTLSGINYLPEYFNRSGGPPLTQEELKKIYSPDTALWIFFYPEPTRRAPGFTWNEEEYGELWNSWLLAVLSHPADYLRHRFGVFCSHLGVNPVWPYWYPAQKDMEKENLPNIFYKQLVGDWVTQAGDQLYFRNFFYVFLIGIVGVIGTFRKTLSLGSKCLICSCFLLLSSHFFLLPGGDFRYSWWLVAVTHFLILTSIPQTVRNSREK